MSDTFKCLLTTVTDIQRTPNTDKLFTVWVKGWVFISSGQLVGETLIPPYKVGDPVVYIQPDSLLDEKLIKFAFPDGMEGKIKPNSLTSHRIKTIKIRKNISEGLLLDPSKLQVEYPALAKAKLEDDVKSILNIKKYEPPVAALPKGMRVTGKVKNPLFKEYVDMNNQKYYPDLFEGEKVYITEKLHGTSARYGLLPAFAGPIFRVAEKKSVYLFQWMYKPRVKLFDIPTKVEFYKKNLVHRFKKLLGLPLGFEFCVGSRRVEISLKGYENGFYSTDIYTKIANQDKLMDKLKPGEEIFGEIIGDGVQGHYTYGHKPGEHSFYAYDVYDHNQDRWLDPVEFLLFCQDRNIKHVPVMDEKGNEVDDDKISMYVINCHSPEFIAVDYSKELIDKLKKGDSLVGRQKIREGVVVKSFKEEKDPRIGRKLLKCISDDYLTQKVSPTEFH